MLCAQPRRAMGGALLDMLAPCPGPVDFAPANDNSIALRILDRFAGRSDAASVSRTAFIPQPMSTPTAAGMIACRVGITLPTVAPIPACTSGIAAT